MKDWARYFDHCQKCGSSDRPHHAKGFCHACYQQRAPRFRRSDGWSSKWKVCRCCETTEAPHHSKGLCTRCRTRNRYRKAHGIPLSLDPYQIYDFRRHRAMFGGAA